jgi:hypothetical protein
MIINLHNQTKIFRIFYQTIYINNILILFVRPTIDSVPGHDIDIRPVSLEPVGPEGGQRGKFSKKVHSGGITE